MELRELRSVRRGDVVDVYRRYIAEAEPTRIYLKPKRVPLWIRLFSWLYPLVS